MAPGAGCESCFSTEPSSCPPSALTTTCTDTEVAPALKSIPDSAMS